ncbi:unnamed protein product [Dicrocoelium dendriticum]|nr:unnamed protein product [Dicrocoelium dendriticum]
MHILFPSIRSFLLLLAGIIAGHLLKSPYYVIVKRWNHKCRYQMTSIPNQARHKLLCYINTHPSNYEKKAIHVQHTWARRCDKFLFTSTIRHPALSIMLLNLTQPEIRQHLWVKMKVILRELYRQTNEYDYFFKADDDTYAVVENLRVALESYNPSDPFMLGYRWNVLCPGGYFSGGAGYLLSRQALKQIVELGIDKHPECPTVDEDKEDVKMCLCGLAAGVKLYDEIGETGLSLFHPYNLNWHPGDWYRDTVPDTASSDVYLRRNADVCNILTISRTGCIMESFSNPPEIVRKPAGSRTGII